MNKKLKGLMDSLDHKNKEDKKKLMEDPKFCRELQKAIEKELSNT